VPTYEYACRECGRHLEVTQSFKDDPLTECPSCSGPLRKVFGAIGIAFKGSGFYKTDSRSGSGAKGPKKDKEAASTSSESKAETKSETKTATKSDSSTGSTGSTSSGSSGGASTAAAS
jgi:putative FmdB family regulatory protein